MSDRMYKEYFEMVGNKIGTECPLCLMELRSDADMQKYCSLCGMGISIFNDISVRRKNRKFDFCSLKCKNKFLKMGFKNFTLFKNIQNPEHKHGML